MAQWLEHWACNPEQSLILKLSEQTVLHAAIKQPTYMELQPFECESWIYNSTNSSKFVWVNQNF